jgi:twitching motility protein PilT
VFIADTTALDPWLSYLWEVGATDLHMSVGSTPRVRVDGKLRAIPDVGPSTKNQLDQFHNGLLSPEDLAEYDVARQLDYSFSWREHARFRANSYYQMGVPALALRLIPTDIPSPEQLGLPEACAALVKKPHGLVLVTGPTGSGKSTTLAAMVSAINQTRPVHILTIEDPIEYVHYSATALVNQREVGSDATSFAAALRAALREDPDVVLVGEMRDRESVALTLTLAETGHLVFATLHTNDTAQTVDRVIDVFPPEQQDQIRTQFSMAIQGVIAQRLIPKIGGGRVAAFEILLGTPAVANLIREGKVRQIRNLVATGQREGMCVLEQSLGSLIRQGLITLEDAQAASAHPDDIAGFSGGSI